MLGQVTSLNMMLAYIANSKDFQEAVAHACAATTRDVTVDKTLRRIALLHDVDVDAIAQADWNKLCRYCSLWCTIVAESN